ncbi:MAG: DUF3341 domain-containing protein [Armatimonadetes bacterium]|nr:DUF3341 domain-containing protein [Armatimonadota bacterium]
MSHGRDTSPKPFAVCASFDNPHDLVEAAKATRAAGYRDIEAYSPVPVEGLCDALEWKDDKLGWVTFLGGLAGLSAGLLLVWWTSTGFQFPSFIPGPTGLNGYGHNTGGKPLFSLPAFVPIVYELTILLSAFGATFGMIGLNGLPKPHHPMFNSEEMKRASQDRFVIAVEATDPRYDEDALEGFFKSLKPLSVERVMTSEGY